MFVLSTSRCGFVILMTTGCLSSVVKDRLPVTPCHLPRIGATCSVIEYMDSFQFQEMGP
jgi:hypothetical protein